MFIFFLLAAVAASTSPAVRTSFGSVNGNALKGVNEYVGVPYAAPPKRFLPPTPWEAQYQAAGLDATAVEGGNRVRITRGRLAHRFLQANKNCFVRLRGAGTAGIQVRCVVRLHDRCHQSKREGIPGDSETKSQQLCMILL